MERYTVNEVSGGAELEEFLWLPFRLFKNDPNFVPQLLSQLRVMFDTARYPFHRHSSVQPFVCRNSRGDLLGRICAIHNKRHLEFHQDGRGFFGFFDCSNDPHVAQSLLQSAAEWLKARGCTHIIGPASFSTNEECGLLVSGFDSPPVIMMPYNPPYYVSLVEQCGLVKAKDLYAYLVEGKNGVPERFERLCGLVAKKHSATVRKLDFSRLDSEMEILFDIYNSAWERNWGFVPMTREEFFFSAGDLSKIADRDIVLVLEVNGEPAGFSLSLPDINPALKAMKGRMLPFGWLHFLLQRRRIDRMRVTAMGIVKEHRKKGVDALLYAETFRIGLKKGYKTAEISWVLEDNPDMNAVAQRIGAVHYKTYRFYERPL